MSKEDTMPLLSWFAHHRFWAFGAGLAVVLAAVAAGVWFFVLRSPGTQVDLRQALRLYRHDQQDPSSADGSLLPAPGVYNYRTSGFERLSVAGISRSFPASSEVVVTDTACATVRWVPFEQHMEGIVECSEANGAVGMVSAISDEEIAGVTTTEVIRCPEDAYFVPPKPVAGQRWSATCHTGGHAVGFVGRELGWSTIAVHGRREPALHTRLTLTFHGGESGSNPTDYWVSPTTGVILKEAEAVDLAQKTGPLGSVSYQEQMAITLTSLGAAH
jgi:hypothetical protein